MVAESWLLRMGNKVSNNVKNALLVENPKNVSTKKQQAIGILSFEVANVMSKLIHLHKSLVDFEVFKLKNGILKSVGIRTLVSDDENRLLELALVEKIDDLNRAASVISRLGRKCTVPALQGFEHVYGDITCGVIDVKDLGFLVKDMEGMVKKMERLVNSTASLYSEMEVMNELEVAMKKLQQNQHEESRKVYEQKLTWHEQEVRQLKDLSLWNQTYDKVVELLVRTVCTVYARISTVFGNAMIKRRLLRYPDEGTQFGCIGSLHQETQEISERSNLAVAETMVEASDADFAEPALCKSNDSYSSGPIERGVLGKRSMSYKGSFGPEYFNLACGIGPGRRFMECLSLSSTSRMCDDYDLSADDRSSQISGCCSVSSGMKREQHNIPGSFDRSLSSVRYNRDAKQLQNCIANAAKHGPKSRITLYAPPTTVGGSALALHYANVIIIIEKLLLFPHLVGEEARDDLYQMLPTSLRRTLETSLKTCMSGLAIYDAPLAHNWKDRLGEILTWLAPLAHNMIRWQSERNFEQQQQIIKRTNVLLLQTLFFADRDKMEAAICELLVGLNYMCRYEQQQTALLGCVNSFNFEDCMEWQLQLGASFNS